MREFRKNIKGRGASHNPDSRFESTQLRHEANESDEYVGEEQKPLLRTEFIRDFSKTIVAENSSPDIPFRYSINPYRGCEHGCAYCYARPSHEYLGFSAGLDFESKILYKPDAAVLLREKLMSRSWKGEHITLSGNTDCYQPVERQMRLTRSCLEVLREFMNPVAMITKNVLVTRDIDLLKPLAEVSAAQVIISITTLDDQLCAALEPRTSRPAARLRAITELSQAGIRVGVNVAPCIPGLNEHEIPAILTRAREAGAVSAGFTMLRLPWSVLPVFTEWLEVHRPERKAKVLQMVQSVRGGQLNDPNFGSRMRGQGAVADNLRQLFQLHVRKLGMNQDNFRLSSEHFRRPGDQMSFSL
jgi:DNA repair photolyase